VCYQNSFAVTPRVNASIEELHVHQPARRAAVDQIGVNFLNPIRARFISRSVSAISLSGAEVMISLAINRSNQVQGDIQFVLNTHQGAVALLYRMFMPRARARFRNRLIMRPTAESYRQRGGRAYWQVPQPFHSPERISHISPWRGVELTSSDPATSSVNTPGVGS
jgi:hypothetical protein